MSARAFVIVRAAWGTALVAAPGMLGSAAGRGSSTRPDDVARLLGARHLLQAAVTVIRPNPRVLVVGAAVDALHSASGVALGMFDPRWRRPAFLDATLAAAFTALGLAAASCAARR